ncbi:hypothetical protein Tco_0395082 [Tanacetum coccineum]
MKRRRMLKMYLVLLNKSTDEQVEGTKAHNEGTEEIFEATLLLNMSQAKAASKEKEKGVELKDVEEINRPRPTVRI